MIYRNVTHSKNERGTERVDASSRNVALQSESMQEHHPEWIRTGLAPIAGTTGMTFRTICRRFGATYGCTELVSARGIAYSHSVEGSLRYLQIDPQAEGPCAIQLFGYEAADFVAAIPLVLSHPVLSFAAWIDLNMGCPVPKVVKTGAGCALMKDLPRASAIIEASVRAAEPFGIPVTVKFRKGWDEQHENAVEFALMCKESGASAVTLHARTRDQLYHGKADWGIIAETADALRGSGVRVIGNGDVRDGESAERMLSETRADGVAVGRAAMGNPWVFSEIAAYLSGDRSWRPPTATERAEVIFEHLDGLTGLLGEECAVKEMRAQLSYYLKGKHSAADCRAQAVAARTAQEVRDIVSRWADAEASL